MNYTVLIRPGVKPWMDRIIEDWLAITIGHTIIAARPLQPKELAHELVHVQQWDRYGLTFPFRYVWSSIKAAVTGKHWYWDNAFEVEAYATAS
jgi:hypothetical protein